MNDATPRFLFDLFVSYAHADDLSWNDFHIFR